MKKITRTVKVSGESKVNGGRWRMQRMSPCPHTITIPPSKTCTSRTTSKSLRIPLVEDDPLTGVLAKQTVSEVVSWIVTEGTPSIWAVTAEMAEMPAKRTVVVGTTILGVARGVLMTVGTLIFWAVDTKVP